MNQIVVILNLIISDDYHFVPAFQPRQKTQVFVQPTKIGWVNLQTHYLKIPSFCQFNGAAEYKF